MGLEDGQTEKIVHSELMCLKHQIWEVHKLLHRNSP